MVLRKVFGQQEADGIGNWTKLHEEELHYLYSITKVFV
jgi:hypothetical protein